jgi:hypothetical protein
MPAGAGEVRFALHVRNDNRERTPPLVRVKALCGPGDDGRSGLLHGGGGERATVVDWPRCICRQAAVHLQTGAGGYADRRPCVCG